MHKDYITQKTQEAPKYNNIQLSQKSTGQMKNSKALGIYHTLAKVF